MTSPRIVGPVNFRSSYRRMDAEIALRPPCWVGRLCQCEAPHVFFTECINNWQNVPCQMLPVCVLSNQYMRRGQEYCKEP